VTRGPQQQRLRDYLDRANQDELRGAAAQWTDGENVLRMISQELERMSGDMARSSDAEFQGETADAARTSFVVSARAMNDKADQLKQGSEAFLDSASALDTAVAEREALAQNDGAQPPVRPSTPPGSTDPADVRAQRDFDTANAAYWDKYRADEQRAADAITALDQSHHAAGEVFKRIHGEPDPVAPAGGGGGGAGGGDGATPTAGGGGAAGGDPGADLDPTDGGPDGPGNGGGGGGDGGGTTNDVPTGDPVPGDPAGPTGPTGPAGPLGTTTPATGGGTSPAGSGGPSAPAAGGGVAAGLGVGVAGGLAGGVAGGLAFPGSVAGTGGTASGGRGIGAGGPRGAGSPVLGRGNGIAGVGNGSGTGTRGTGRAAGRAGPGGTSGRGTGRGGGARGAAGSRGMLGGAGTGAGTGTRSGRRGDERRPGEEHELFDDGQDWLDDEDAYDGVID
jgi:hypothetical protein